MQTFCGYRTRLLPEGRAFGFAKFIQANPSFTGVTVHERPTAKDPKRRFYVTYTAARPARQTRLRRVEVTTRRIRAHQQAGNYTFWADPDHRGLYWCHNHISGEVYEVSRKNCSCPDYCFRGSQEGVPCKHIVLLRNWLGDRRAGRPVIQKTLTGDLFPGEGTFH